MNRNEEKGFTLVETLVAISILMIALAGPFYSIQQALLASYAARDQLIGSALGQEGIEYIYYLRDNNYFTGSSWLNGMSACTGTYGCAISPASASSPLTACTNSTCSNVGVLKIDSTTGLYQYSSGAASRFTRIVKVVPSSTDPDKEATVTSTVTWSTSHRDFQIGVTDTLYNWL